MKNKYLGLNKVFSVDIPIYDIDLVVMVGDDIPALKKQLEELVKEDLRYKLDELWNQHDISLKGYYTHNDPLKVIYMSETEDYHEFISVLSHEILHAVFNIAKYVGLKYSDKSEEAYTYLTGYITREIYKQLDEYIPST